MLRNTRSFEKNSFIRFLRLSQVRSLFASEYEQAQTAYERYINCIQRLFRPGKLSPADTLHMMAKLRIKLIAIQEEPVKVAPEMESLLRAAIALTNFEIAILRSWTVVRKSHCRSLRFIWQNNLRPQILWK